MRLSNSGVVYLSASYGAEAVNECRLFSTYEMVIECKSAEALNERTNTGSSNLAQLLWITKHVGLLIVWHTRLVAPTGMD
jgi:hypothetical protein